MNNDTYKTIVEFVFGKSLCLATIDCWKGMLDLFATFGDSEIYKHVQKFHFPSRKQIWDKRLNKWLKNSLLVQNNTKPKFDNVFSYICLRLYI